MTTKIKIVWYDSHHVDKSVIGETLTDDDYNEENVAMLSSEINESDEGLDAPDGWQIFDLVPYEEE